MEITSVLPGVRIAKEENEKEEVLFISQNDQIKVNVNGTSVAGTFLGVEYASCTEEDDILHMIKEDDNAYAVRFDDIENIEKA